MVFTNRFGYIFKASKPPKDLLYFYVYRYGGDNRNIFNRTTEDVKKPQKKLHKCSQFLFMHLLVPILKKRFLDDVI